METHFNSVCVQLRTESFIVFFAVTYNSFSPPQLIHGNSFILEDQIPENQ